MLRQLHWIVVPGGPGLSRKYLEIPFSSSFHGCKLHYFDLFGSPESTYKTPSLGEMVDQVGSFAESQGLNGYGLIVHSFGSYLAFQFLQTNQTQLKAIVLVSPMPLQKNLWQTSLASIAEKVPKEELKEIAILSKSTQSGSELFKKIYPYYTTNPQGPRAEYTSPIEFDDRICQTISAQVPEYDHRSVLNSCKIPTVRIIGENDPFFVEKNVLNLPTVVIPKVGHYPFVEDPSGFDEALKQADTFLCQKNH